jgi:hypothetical protein
MSRTEARWLGAVLFVGAGLLGAPGCAGDTTNNFAACGPGTRHDPDLNACVPIDGDAAAGSGGAAGNSGAAGMSGSAGTGQAGSAGVGGFLPDAGDASQQEDAPAPDPNDDACLTTGVFIVNGDKACGTYNPVGVCSGTEPNTIELPELTEEDIALADPWDPTTGGVWVRTPSHPGANAACGDGCSRPGTIARIRIPIRHVGYSKPLIVVVAHEDETNSHSPWHISEAVINEYCSNEADYECWDSPVTESNFLIETEDPEAPARNFHIFAYAKYPGACNEYL